MKKLILFLALILPPMVCFSQGLLDYEPSDAYKSGTNNEQTAYIVRLTGYIYNVASEKLSKVPIKIQIIEGKYNDSYKFIAYKSDFGWNQNFVGTPTIYKVSQSDNLYEYFDYCVTTPIGKIYFNIE